MAVECHEDPSPVRWKALTDAVKKRQEEAARLLQLEELQNRGHILDIVQHQHSSSPIKASLDEAGPDLGGETLLESFLIHHPTLIEPLDGQVFGFAGVPTLIFK